MQQGYDSGLNHISALVKQAASPQQTILLMLMELGVPAKRDGFSYLQQAIWLFYRDPTQLITKSLYPEVASRSGRHTTAKPVEHSIRSAIGAAWESRNNAVWQRYFTPTAEGDVPRPTNTEFISRLALVLQLWETGQNSAV